MKKLTCVFTSFFVFACTFSLMAQDEAAPPRDQGMWQTLALIGIALVFFYFILWRPEQKRRRELENKRSSLQKGDKVTAMGIIGKVVRVGEHTIILSMYDGSKVEFLKAAITDVVSGGGEESETTQSE